MLAERAATRGSKRGSKCPGSPPSALLGRVLVLTVHKTAGSEGSEDGTLAAVEVDGRARDIGAARRQQEADEIGELLGPATRPSGIWDPDPSDA